MTGGAADVSGAGRDGNRYERECGSMAGGETSRAPQVVTLTLSPARDLTIDVEAIDLGTSHRVAQAGGRLGGKGINVARVLAALDRSVYVQGPVNTTDWPEAAGPTYDLVWDLTPTPARLRRSYALVESSGRATLFNERASEHPVELWEQIEEKLRSRLVEPQVRALAISGSTPVDLPEGFVDRIVADAHASGVSVVVDTSGPALITAAKAGADWLKPNTEELAELAAADATPTGSDQTRVGARPEDDVVDVGSAGMATDFQVRGASALIAAGAGAVLASRGEAGLVLIDRTGLRSAAKLDQPVQGNPTGAGDAVVAALLSRLAEGTGSQSREATCTDDSAASRAADASLDDSAVSLNSADASLTDVEVESILTDAVAISASAVLMPQAGAIHGSWRALRDRVQIMAPAEPTSSAPEERQAPTTHPAPAGHPSPTDNPGE
ncbi:1-phosphofructokinase family hexose kinase [Brevibacterium oceani]|uniref:1-phosphofructokinase family hexose kinase n=1 Tax=Brevibacterium oceani TaxID=358099 RepID=UPI001B33CE03|nr:PfkB family carbohydrate kinase [Brevibacterium oceani]